MKHTADRSTCEESGFCSKFVHGGADTSTSEVHVFIFMIDIDSAVALYNM